MGNPAVMQHGEAPDVTRNKRKRSSGSAGSASPDSRRTKRAVPTANMDASDNSFLENAVSIAQAAQDHVNVDDFSALAQATAEHHEAVDTANVSSTAAAALNMYPTLHVPVSTEETFAAQVTSENQDDSGYDASPLNEADGLPNHGLATHGLPTDELSNGPLLSPTHSLPATGAQNGSHSSSGPKPTVGSEEWHKMRKDNHKEVERRRRETINEGINELAKIVPNCEKNKGSILGRAVTFIKTLKENETQNIEKWTLEKLLTEQAIAELSSSNDKLKMECERLFRELETWKKVAQQAGLQPPQPKAEGAAAS